MKKNYDSSIGKRIREKREMLGYSREYVAEQAEMSPVLFIGCRAWNKGFLSFHIDEALQGSRSFCRLYPVWHC